MLPSDYGRPADRRVGRIAGFGRFHLRHRPPRAGRNPRTGETIPIPAKAVPTFTAGKAFQECVQPRAAAAGVLREAHVRCGDGAQRGPWHTRIAIQAFWTTLLVRHRCSLRCLPREHRPALAHRCDVHEVGLASPANTGCRARERRSHQQARKSEAMARSTEPLETAVDLQVVRAFLERYFTIENAVKVLQQDKAPSVMSAKAEASTCGP